MTRILHLSDPHFGASDPVVAEAVLGAAAEIAPDLVILSGDLTMRARRAELSDARDFIARLPRPRLVIAGNHDIPAFNQPFDRFFRPFRRYRQAIGELEPEYLADDVHVVSLNSNRAYGMHADWSEGRLSRAGLERAARKYRSDSPGLRLLVLHHPLVAPAGHGRAVVKPLPELLELIGHNRVDLVLCGHFHRSLVAMAGPDAGWQCLVSQAPTACSTRLQGEPQGFHEILHSGDRAEIILHRYHDGRFVAEPALSFARESHGWRAS